MWQVSGRSDITDFEEVVRLDTEYISNWNFGLDQKAIETNADMVSCRIVDMPANCFDYYYYVGFKYKSSGFFLYGQ